MASPARAGDAMHHPPDEAAHTRGPPLHLPLQIDGPVRQRCVRWSMRLEATSTLRSGA